LANLQDVIHRIGICWHHFFDILLLVCWLPNQIPYWLHLVWFFCSYSQTHVTFKGLFKLCGIN